jgi:DnaJ family protein B protein 12
VAPDEPKPREYTPAQAALVKRVKSCRTTAYYEILQLEKTCSEGDIKKAYKKVSRPISPDLHSRSDKHISLRSSCTRIRMVPRAQMKLLNVRVSWLRRSHRTSSSSCPLYQVVSKAFQILQDPQSRSHYDRFGDDVPLRGNGGGGGGPGPTFRTAGGHAAFDEVSPEDLFRMFFGGGMGGGGFGGPGFVRYLAHTRPGKPCALTFSCRVQATTFYGPNGFRTTSFGGGPPRQRPAAGGGGRGAAGEPDSTTSMWIQLLPLILLFAFSVLSQLPSLFATPEAPDPSFAFRPTSFHSVQRTTHAHPSVDYWVNPKQFSSHPMYDDLVSRNPALGFSSSHDRGTKSRLDALFQHLLSTSSSSSTSPPTQQQDEERRRTPVGVVPSPLASFERRVVASYIQRLQTACQDELEEKRDLLNRHRGFFGLGGDPDRYSEVQAKKLENCEALKSLGYRVVTD